MPTGYTYPVAEGKITTLREFALQCARAFGATIMMRDEPMDAPIPDKFEADTSHYEARLAEARAVLADLPGLSISDCETRASEAYEAALTAFNKYEAERAAENKRMRDMMDAVRAWETQAEGIKDFMLEQLRISISDYKSPAPTKLTGGEWREREIKHATHNVEYAEKHIADEIERTAGRNKWLADLRASLPA